MKAPESSWPTRSLQELCSVTRLAGAEYTMFWEADPQGEIIALRGQNIGQNRLILEDCERISRNLSLTLSRSKLCAGDIVFPCVGSIGNAAIILDDDRFHINQNIAKVRAHEGVCPEYILCFLLSDLCSRQVVEFNTSGAQPSVLVGSLRRFKVPAPPLPQQREIARILLTWDSGMGPAGALVSAAKALKRALMQQLLTGQARFKGFVKSSQQVNTRYGCFPTDWAAVHIGDVADVISDKNDAGRELPVLSCTKHRGLVNSLEYFGKRIFSADTSNYKVVRRGDFAYATNHIEEGSIGYQDLHDAALISPMYTVFRTRAGVDHSFFFKLVKTELYRHIFEVNTSGSIARRGGLRWDEFAIIKVFLPSVPEQKRIAAVLGVCDREIELLQKQLAALKEQKRGLMQKLLTGEVRVKAEGRMKNEE